MESGSFIIRRMHSIICSQINILFVYRMKLVLLFYSLATESNLFEKLGWS